MLLIATVGVCIFLPFSLSFGFVPFLIIMLIALFFRFIVDSAIPTALVLIIPESQMGAYSSIRMLIFTAAQAVAAIMITPMVDFVGYTGVLIFAIIMQLICGVVHYIVVVNRRRKISIM
jgi:predicted MFS family arabinose efflux permease